MHMFNNVNRFIDRLKKTCNDCRQSSRPK